MVLKVYSIALEPEVMESLDKIAKAQERSRSFLLRQSIKKIIDETKYKECKDNVTTTTTC